MKSSRKIKKHPALRWRMLNLKAGQKVAVKTGLMCVAGSRSIIGTVRSKTVHGKHMHSYLITWPTKGSKTPTGRHFWDYGVANRKKRAMFVGDTGIVFCRRLCKK